MWSGIWSVATTWIGFWTWIWPTRPCGLRQEVASWFQCWKNFTSFQSKNTGANDVKMDGSVLEEKSSFKMLGLTFPCKFDWGSYIISTGKTASKKIGALIHSMKFPSPDIWPYDHVWNTVITSGLVLLVATWNCWISYKNGHAGLLLLHLLPPLYPWLIVEM